MGKEITVKILNWNCLKDESEMALAVDDDNNLVLKASSNDENQQWTLIPNLVRGGAAGGYTLHNVGKGMSAEEPPPRQQIRLNNETTPYGSRQYCWTIFDSGQGDGEQLWAIQTYNRGDVMDAARASCSDNTQVVLFGFNRSDNQRWVIRQV